MIVRHQLEASCLRVAFGGRQILSDAYLRIETETVAALVGRNGQGKTTLLQAVYGTLRSEGSVCIDGRFRRFPYMDPSLIRYLPQFSFLPLSLTAERVLRDFGLSFSRFIALFPDFPATPRARLRSLSGGWLRLLETYAVLCAPAWFVLLDEPFTHLSPLHIESLKTIIEQERASKGIVLTDHMTDQALSVSTVIYMLREGVLMQAASPSSLAVLGYRVP